MKKYWIAALVMLLVPLLAFAQSTLRGTITVVVVDSSALPVPGAGLKLVDVGRNQTYEGETSGAGVFTFSNLNPGTYRVEATKEGFSRSVSSDIAVVNQESLRVDLSLQVGSTSSVVEVTATAPTIATGHTTVGALTNRAALDRLPVPGRNYVNMANLAPNVSTYEVRSALETNDAAGANHVTGMAKFKAGGGGDNNFAVNGIITNDNFVDLPNFVPSVEAISEVKVDVANFSPESGHSVSSVTASTRGGSNQLHGTAYENLMNSALSAWNPYLVYRGWGGGPKDAMQYNQFGGNLGGPVVIPRLFNGRDKAFFFINVEKTIKNSKGESQILRVPTAKERTGDFSEMLGRFAGNPELLQQHIIYDPLSTQVDEQGFSHRTPFPNNVIPADRIRQEMREILSLYPEPNMVSADPFDLKNYRGFQRKGFGMFRLDSRFDYRFSDSDNVFLTVSRSSAADDNASAVMPEMVNNKYDQGWLITGNHVHVFSPTLTNEIMGGWGKALQSSPEPNVLDYLRRGDTLRSKFFRNTDYGVDRNMFAIWMGDFPWIAPDGALFIERPTLQFGDNIGWFRGSHSLKAGINYMRRRDYGWWSTRWISFDNRFSRAGSADGGLGGDTLASFLMGMPTDMAQPLRYMDGDPANGIEIPYWGAYLLDNIQITPKLSVMLGLRYELDLPLRTLDRTGNAVVDMSYPGWQLAIPGRASGFDYPYPAADTNNFAPRISIAYRPWSDFVVRASYGIFYNLGSGKSLERRIDGAHENVPGRFGVTTTFNNGSAGVHDDVVHFTMEDIFPAPVEVNVGTYPISTGAGTGHFGDDAWISHTFRDNESAVTSYNQRWHFELQKGLDASTALSLSYMGSHATKLPFNEPLNNPGYRTNWATSELFNAARPNNTGRFGGVYVVRPGLDSVYHGATVRVNRNFAKGLQFDTHYTFSKTIAEEGGFDWNRHLNRGESLFSHPHRFIAALVWEIPGGQNLNRFIRPVIAGWRLSSITTFESGHAFTPSNDLSSARDHEPDRPNILRNPNLSGYQRSIDRYFDTAAFEAPPNGVKGNAGMGIIRGPGQNNWNVSLGKKFAVTERFNVDFRCDGYNVFNNSQWTWINTQLGNPWFGQVEGSKDGRIFEFGLRLNF